MLEFEKLIERVNEAVKAGTKQAMDQLTREYNTSVQSLVKTGWVTSNCSDIIFINYTPLSVTVNGNVQVNNYILQPGGFLSIGGNNAEINRTEFNCVFDSAATLCVVIKKLYTQR